MLRSGVVLAGGKATRMGGDKALAKFRGRPLISWALDALSEVVDELAVSVAPGKGGTLHESLRGAGFGQIKIVEDETPYSGPINGMLSSFPRLRGELVAVAPCDSPFMAKGLYPMLFDMVRGHDCAVLKVGGRYEPLHAVYRRKPMLKAMERTVAEGSLKPVDAYRDLRIFDVPEAELLRIDPGLMSLVNINTQEELKRSQ